MSWSLIIQQYPPCLVHLTWIIFFFKSKFCLFSSQSTVTGLSAILNWIMGAPAGLKLNYQLNLFLGSFFKYNIYVWTSEFQIWSLTYSLQLLVYNTCCFLQISKCKKLGCVLYGRIICYNYLSTTCSTFSRFLILKAREQELNISPFFQPSVSLYS